MRAFHRLVPLLPLLLSLTSLFCWFWLLFSSPVKFFYYCCTSLGLVIRVPFTLSSTLSGLDLLMSCFLLSILLQSFFLTRSLYSIHANFAIQIAMVGAKRKLDTAHGLAAEGASPSSSNVSQPIHPRINPNLVVDAQSGRITRSAATQAGRTPRGNDKSQNSTTPSTTSTPSRRSRIIKLNTRGALPTNPSPSHVRETRTLRGRAAAAPSASSNKVEPAAVQLPETPRVKRIKRGSVAEETPRSTRQSARIRHHQGISGLDEPADDKPLEPSPTKHSGSRGNIQNQNHTDTAAVETRSPSPREVASDVHQDSKSVDPDVAEDPDPEDPPTEEISDDSQHKVDSTSSPDATKPDLPPLSQADSQKHDSQETENDVAAANEEPPTPSNRKPKFEDADLDRALEQQLQNGTAEKHESLSTADATEESRADDESRQITDAEESSVANGVESTKSTANGPGGARAVAARNRAAKGKGRPRGKGVAGRRAAAGRGRQVDSPEFRTERSPSPFAAARKLLDRKSELDRAFKKVAAAQRLALHVMAVRTERQLARDKNAHRKVPEFEKVEAVLAAYRQKKQDSLRYEYECRIKQENLLFAAEQDRIEQRCRVSCIRPFSGLEQYLLTIMTSHPLVTFRKSIFLRHRVIIWHSSKDGARQRMTNTLRYGYGVSVSLILRGC